MDLLQNLFQYGLGVSALIVFIYMLYKIFLDEKKASLDKSNEKKVLEHDFRAFLINSNAEQLRIIEKNNVVFEKLISILENNNKKE